MDQPEVNKEAGQKPGFDLGSLVYKTMPKGYSSTSYKPPKQEPQSIPKPEPASGVPAPMPPGKQAARMYIIVVAGLIVLGALGYAGYAFFGKDKPVENKNDQSQDQGTNNAFETQIDAQWRTKYFGGPACTNPNICGDDADPDIDGLSNLKESQLETDPNNFDSDSDGIADGDEVNIFGLNPLNPVTSGIDKYPDVKEIELKWNVLAKRLYTDAELKVIAEKIATDGLHAPTTSQLNAETIQFYTNYGSEENSAPTDPGALNRDIQRVEAIKQIGFALLKYKNVNSAYPNTNIFADMIKSITSHFGNVAVNTNDPLNKTPYIYSYQPMNAAKDFKLSYFSETQNQAVNFAQADVIKLQSKAELDQRDNQRVADIEMLAGVLEVYGMDHATESARIYPNRMELLVPEYLEIIPMDPLGKPYVYSRPEEDVFRIETVLENPPSGSKGYYCAAEDFNDETPECKYY